MLYTYCSFSISHDWTYLVGHNSDYLCFLCAPLTRCFSFHTCTHSRCRLSVSKFAAELFSTSKCYVNMLIKPVSCSLHSQWNQHRWGKVSSKLKGLAGVGFLERGMGMVECCISSPSGVQGFWPPRILVHVGFFRRALLQSWFVNIVIKLGILLRGWKDNFALRFQHCVARAVLMPCFMMRVGSGSSVPCHFVCPLLI